MAKSWLEKAKSIYDLGGPDYVRKAGEYDDEKDDRAAEKWLKTLRKEVPVEPQYRAFFHTRMHDSWVMEIRRSRGVLRVTLDSFSADQFAFALSRILGVEFKHHPAPVDLLLHDATYVRAARSDPNGALRFADWKSLKSEDTQFACGGFLYDWFFEQDGRLQWIADIDASQPETQMLSSSIYLMVDCAKATAVDRRAAALEKVNGESGRQLWEDALAHKGDIWAIELMRDFLRERMEARSLSPNDFKSPLSEPSLKSTLSFEARKPDTFIRFHVLKP